MPVGRRTFLRAAAAGVATRCLAVPSAQGSRDMYGLIGKMTTVPGQRDAFVTLLLDGLGEMPGCLSYIVAKDPQDENALWITEVWDSKASHEASLSLPSVKEAIAKGKPMIAGFGERLITTPVGGHGLGR
jgi:quinol monooxygenase YgiN